MPGRASLPPFVPSPECRIGCGACCIAPSISSPIPGMLDGKPAGVRCVQLTHDNRCHLFGLPQRPAVCSNLRPSFEMCGESAGDAMFMLSQLEYRTRPDPSKSIHE
ncbi:MAG: YkgJ family cysteine cluster protein [Chloroflexota bacterium]